MTKKICGKCDGKGRITSADTSSDKWFTVSYGDYRCPNCKGEGRVEVEESK